MWLYVSVGIFVVLLFLAAFYFVVNASGFGDSPQVWEEYDWGAPENRQEESQ